MEAPPALPPRIIVPAECGLFPVAPSPVDAILLPPLPAPTAPDYPIIRLKRAELAGLYFQGKRDAEELARKQNAATQEKCAKWAQEQGE